MDRGDNFNAWNPGLESEIPSGLKKLITLFREETSEFSYEDAVSASELCGLKPQELHCLSIKRLVMHELLVRVTADLTVPDGPKYEDLGIAIRAMATRILNNHLEKELEYIEERFEQFVHKASIRIRDIFTNDFLSLQSFKRNYRKKPKLLDLFRTPARLQSHASETHQIMILKKWSTYTESENNFDARCKFSLARIISGIIGVRGKLVSDSELFLPLAVIVFKNTFGGIEISRLVAPLFCAAVTAEGYRTLPAQEMPIVMNTKGASASGKSTIRPQQRLLSEKMNIPWEDFALISPDYWRKFLLDYDSLGADYKYGAMLTSYELEIIDKKLDLYMEQKALVGQMPHLLIDRFRFDSFIVSGDGNYTSRLLTRFGQKVFLFFIITSPIETVERAWRRGLLTSRYKAVDDLLFHNIEAYTGMPELFFSWMSIADKEINFEFLDNNVLLGELPKTIAFGKIGKMVIFDLLGLNNIDRFKEINVDAENPNEVLCKNEETSDYDFVKQCLVKISEVIFVDKKTSHIFGIYREGSWVYINKSYEPTTPEEKKCLFGIGWYSKCNTKTTITSDYYSDLEHELTIGRIV